MNNKEKEIIICNDDNENIIKSITKLIDFEADLRKSNNSYLFRGQYDCKWKLQSSYKHDYKKKHSKIEEDISAMAFVEIIKKKIKYIQERVSRKTDLEILAELQHYMAPTLLVDFTANFWNAVWFAISEIHSYESLYFRIYYLKLDEKNDKDEYKDLIWDEQKIYHCPDNLKNGLAQKSYFILDNSDSLESDLNIESVLIPFNLRDDLLDLLNKNKINSSTIYPGLKGLYQSFENYSNESEFLLNFQNKKIKENEKKIKDFNQTLKYYKDYYNIGSTFTETKEYLKAIEYFNKAIELNPNSAKSYNNKGNALIDIKKYDEALMCFNKAIELDPYSSKFWNNKGFVLLEKRLFDESIKCFNKAIELDPNNSGAFNNIGLALKNKDEKDDALFFFERALKINPDNIDALNNKGNILFEQGKHDEAHICFDKIIKLDPTYEKAFHNKANIFMVEKNIDKTLEYINKAINLDSKNYEDFNNKGFILMQLKKYDEALQCFDKALELNPNSSIVYINKGIIMNTSENYNDALKYFNKALELDSTNFDAYINKGSLLIKLEKYTEAIICFNKALIIDDKNIMLHFNKGIILWKLKLFEESIECFEKILELKLVSKENAFYVRKGIELLQENNFIAAMGYFYKVIEIEKVIYRFKCSQCGHEYVHNSEHISNCPKCGHINNSSGKFSVKQ